MQRTASSSDAPAAAQTACEVLQAARGLFGRGLADELVRVRIQRDLSRAEQQAACANRVAVGTEGGGRSDRSDGFAMLGHDGLWHSSLRVCGAGRDGSVQAMANALAGETSPYLLQHRDNPVDWLPWGEQALARSRELDRPLLVSIGYSACHWCHVMERECFENEEIAALMNERFVCVKVDREERPDVDAIYMEAVQAMTGSGGWPLNVFLTPEQVPFYAGTYFPPEARRGMPSWPSVLRAVAEAWDTRREEIVAQNGAMTARLTGAAQLKPAEGPLSRQILDDAARRAAVAVRRGQRWLGRRAEVPGLRSTIEFLLRRGETADDLYARCARWPPAASMTRSAAASRATPSTTAGRSRTSRRCSTTTRCSLARTCTAGR